MVVSVASQKGGTGKTSTSLSLASGLARHGKHVLLVDIDSQANSSKVLIPNYLELRKENTIYATILERQLLPVQCTTIPNLDIVPSHILLSNKRLHRQRSGAGGGLARLLRARLDRTALQDGAGSARIFQPRAQDHGPPVHDVRPDHQQRYVVAHPAADLPRPGAQDGDPAQHRPARCPFQ
ncbi:MAG: AAA family ATPase [Chloroflexi bacterium]|nr:AAA family ATPase [Chloroflexota bacterium]